MNKYLFTLMLLPTLSFGANHKMMKKDHPKTWVKADVTPFTEMQDTKALDRKVASDSSDLTNYNQLVSGFNSVKSASDIEKFINDTKKKSIIKSDPSSLFLSAHLQALSSLRGAFWRLKPLFEANGGENRFTHSLVVSFIKHVAGFTSIVNPTEQSAAVLDYLSAPFTTADGKLVGKISSEPELQNWMQSSLRVEILGLIKQLNTISPADRVTWNQQLVYGDKSFVGNNGKEVEFGYDEVQALVSSYEMTVAEIDMFCSYYQDGAISLFQDTGKLYGFDGFLFDNVDGVTGIEISKVLKNPNYTDLWTLNTDIAPEAMKEAYTLISSAERRSEATWNHLAKRPLGSNMMFSPLLNQLAGDKANATFMNARRVLKGEAVRSSVTGEVVKFNTVKFFNEPPQDLKKFYPISFSTQKTKKVTLNIEGKSKQVTYRDFSHGSPLGWNVSEYQKYFDVSNDAGVKSSLRAMNHALGGMFVK
jgi:hypothetical protein